MRPLLIVIWVLTCCASLFAPPADGAPAQKRRARPLTVVVLPFTGEDVRPLELREAIELELELVDGVKVGRGALVRGDLKRARTRAFQTRKLASILKRRRVDVLIRGERAGKGLRVVAYGKDGRPRFFTDLALQDDLVATATALLDELKPLLPDWRTMKPVRVPPAPPVEPLPVAEDPAERSEAPSPDIAAGQPGPDGQQPPPAGQKKDDLSADAPPGKNSRPPGHTFSVVAAFDGGSWFYNFDAVGFGEGAEGDKSVTAAFYPGGSIQLDYWAFPWLGVDGDFAAMAIPFRIDSGNPDIEIVPGEFVAAQFRGSAAFKLRYVSEGGFGIGGRVGYRFFGAFPPPQTFESGGEIKNFTVVPGYQLHAATIGAEVFVPFLIADRLLEIELRADALPLTFYAEAPDNPGARSVAFGWAATLGVRYAVLGGFFIEARGHTTGVSGTYEGAGERVDFAGNELKPLQGGSVLNLTAGFAAGLGYLF